MKENLPNKPKSVVNGINLLYLYFVLSLLSSLYGIWLMLSIWVAIFLLLDIGFILFFVLMVRDGRNWARLCLLVYIVFAILSFVLTPNILSLVWSIILIAAGVFLFQKPSTEWFNIIKESRQPSKKAELSVSTAELSVIRGILIVGLIAGTLFTTVGVLGWASMEVEPTTQKILDEGIVDFFRGPWDDIDGMLRSQKIKYETKKKKFENFFYIGIGVLVICALGFFKIQKKVVESKAKDFESKKDDLLEKF